MVIYSCETDSSSKEIKPNSQYDIHNIPQKPDKNNDDKSQVLVENVVEEKLNVNTKVMDNKQPKKLKIKKKLKILEDIVVNSQISNISPLRYPGGKTRACKKLEIILNQHFDISQFENFISPFFGGGSFEFYMQNNYQLNIIANDKFTPLYNFWKTCKIDKEILYKELTKKIGLIDKAEFTCVRGKIMEETNTLNQSIMYFIINRCSFSGATLSGGFSLEASKKRFTKSSVDRIKNLNLTRYDIYNLDFEDFINSNLDKKNFIFLDPPYYLEKASNLYGNNGDMHDTFEHDKLYKCLSTKRNWLMTYNNCDYIKNLYKDFIIIETSWNYGMNKSKISSEIVIIG